MLIGYILLFGSMGLFFVTLGWLLPRWLLRVKYANVKTADRGLRRCLFKGKRCVVYEVSRAQRKYVRRYALCQEKGYKTLKCHVASSVTFLEYDVVLFNRYDEITGVLHVKENLTSLYTRSVQLPDDTAYISLVLRRANKESFERKPLMLLSRGKILLFALLTLLLTAAEGFVIKVGCAYAFGGVFREDYISSLEGTLWGLGAALAVALVGLLFALVPIRHRAKK